MTECLQLVVEHERICVEKKINLFCHWAFQEAVKLETKTVDYRTSI